MRSSVCEEKDVLHAAYRQAVLVYDEVVSELDKVVGAAVFSEYELARRKAAAVRNIVIRTREKLHKHVEAHGCH